MATELERLVITLEARTKAYENALAKAQGVTLRQLKAIEGAVNTSARGMESRFATVGSTITRSLASLGAGISFAALTRGVGQAVSDLGDLGEAAQSAGLSVEKLQELQFGGLAVGVATEQLVQAMGAFNSRIAEAARNGGDLYEVLKANGIAILDANGNFRETSAILDDVADAIKNATSEQERLNLAGEVFGERIGRRLIPLLIQGSEGLRKMAEEARRTGFVVEESIVNAADRAADKWNQFWAQFWKSAAADAGTLIAGFEQVFGSAEGFAEAFLNVLRGVQTEQQKQVAAAEEYRAKLAEINQLVEDRNALIERGFSLDSLPVVGLTEQLKAARAELDALVQGFDNLESQSPVEVDVNVNQLPSVTRGVGGTASPEVARMATAIEQGFAKELQQIEAIKQVLAEGNLTSAQRTSLMERLATLQGTQTQAVQGLTGAVSALPAQIYQPIVGAIGAQESELQAISHSVDGVRIETLASGEKVVRSVGAAGEGIISAVDNVSNAVGLVVGGINSVVSAIANVAANLGTGPGVTTELGFDPALQQKQELAALEAERQQLQLQLQTGELTAAETKAAEKRIAEIGQEIAKLQLYITQLNNAIASIDIAGLQAQGYSGVDLIRKVALLLEQMGFDVLDAFNAFIDQIGGFYGPAPEPYALGGEVLRRAHGGDIFRRRRPGMISGPGGPMSDDVPILASAGEWLTNAMETRQHRRLLELINSGGLSRGSVGDRLLKMLAAEGFNLAAITGEGETQASHLPAGMQWAQSMGMRPSREPSGGAIFGDINVVIQAYDRPVRGSERAIGYRVSREIAHHMRQAGVRV